MILQNADDPNNLNFHDGHRHVTFYHHGQRDKPLSFHWRAQEQGWLDQLDLPPGSSVKYAQARSSILVESYLVARAEPGRSISYSRRREFYAGEQRYKGLPYTYTNVLGSIDEAAKLGLIHNQKATPGQRGWQSSFQATDKLMEAINRPVPVIYDPCETIRLRDSDRKLIDYRDTARTDRMRKRLNEINEAITSAEIDLEAPDAVHGEHAIQCGDHTLYPAMQSLFRVFNRGSFSLGGRMYGGWWQQARKADRTFITIDGEQTTELDYPSLHPSMLYAQIGRTINGDPYEVEGWPRKLVKLAFNVMVNARTQKQALSAIAERIGGEGCFDKARRLMDAIVIKHALIADAFGSDAGLRLQRIDADMAEHVVLSLIHKGIIALPVHDSFAVREQDKDDLMEAMADALERFVLVTNTLVPSIGYSNLVPQMEGDPIPLVVLPPVAGFQLDLFGGVSCTVPFNDVAGWSGGLAPVGIRNAIRHELKRRGLRHSDLAETIGVSRSQLGNVLQGRFGAGQQVARGLRDFILEGADTIGLVAA